MGYFFALIFDLLLQYVDHFIADFDSLPEGVPPLSAVSEFGAGGLSLPRFAHLKPPEGGFVNYGYLHDTSMFLLIVVPPNVI